MLECRLLSITGRGSLTGCALLAAGVRAMRVPSICAANAQPAFAARVVSGVRALCMRGVMRRGGRFGGRFNAIVLLQNPRAAYN